MFTKAQCMAYFAQLYGSNGRRSLKRAIWHVKSLLGRSPALDIYLCVSDPYSYLLVQVLPLFLQKYRISYRIYIIHEHDLAMFPEWDKWCAYSLEDAQYLAQLYEIRLPNTSFETIYDPNRRLQYALQIAQLPSENMPIDVVTELFDKYWNGVNITTDAGLAPAQEALQRLEDNQARLQQNGHYLTGSLNYAGEWYWGIDRLIHLEHRLQGRLQGQTQALFDRQHQLLSARPQFAVGATCLPALIMYFSARSPFSYLGLELANRLAKQWGIRLDVRPVLPMLMRGLNVPSLKKLSIFLDNKRECELYDVPYGKVADPLGKGVERSYAVFYYAKKMAKEVSFLLALGKAVNAFGIDVATDKGLAKVAHTVGLDWQDALQYIENEDWRTLVEQNQSELSQFGLWGVPVFSFDGITVWGQDRLWVIRQRIEQLVRER